MRRRSVLLFLLSALLLPLGAQEANLAQAAAATASSSESAKYAPAKALDGNAATGWASLPAADKKGDAQWIVVDLGSSLSIARVVLNWGIASAKAYRLESSKDGKSWKKVASRKDMAAGIREDELAGLKIEARYLRVSCTARAASATQYSLRELRAYAAAPPPPPSAALPAAPAAKTLAPVEAATSAAAEAPAEPERRSGPFVDLGCGWAFPLGDAADTLEQGVFPVVAAGWQFPLGPGRLKLGLESGALFESTKDEYEVFAQYSSVCVPVGALLAYDMKLFWRLRAYARVSGGYSATFVNYDSEALEDLGVWKPYFGAAAGLGIELAPWLGANIGARFARVFYDEHPCSYLSPELGIGLRF
jgi:hypothetical protein